jgi:hypothetical protein
LKLRHTSEHQQFDFLFSCRCVNLGLDWRTLIIYISFAEPHINQIDNFRFVFLAKHNIIRFNVSVNKATIMQNLNSF